MTGGLAVEWRFMINSLIACSSRSLEDGAVMALSTSGGMEASVRIGSAPFLSWQEAGGSGVVMDGLSRRLAEIVSG